MVISEFGKIINPDGKLQSFSQPYKFWVIDNFLHDNIIDLILDNWLDSSNPNWHNEYSNVDGDRNLLERGMKSISKLDLMPNSIAELLTFFHHDQFTQYLETLLNINDLLSDRSMRWSGMRNMMPNSFQLIHSDARKSLETGLRKELTCLLYLNRDYDKIRDQGCLEIWNDEMSECVYSIEPIANRMLIFQNSDTSYHGVPVVLSERKAITFSILKKESATDRYKALFVPRPFDNEDIKLQGLKRSKL